MRFLRSYNLYLAWLVSVIALCGSLYLSEIMLFEPCKLCWFQRICMYPLAVLLGIAAYRSDRGIILYTRTLSIVGMCIPLYQYLEQKVPAMQKILPCTIGVPCSGQYINWLGFITIPFLALVGFLLITILLSIRENTK
ncbi:disulfide bond formation protein B [Tumebacillus sp. ITR2]|uniref:Disulfide bond formation protein B n=2 Tax=Tumebacillus amylolyticus TaxID=2801339 RepID=A0ABS1J5W7_9BACL|nr:disulfide bond formation protein B [Tumebacillus amylolyticus]